MHQENTDNPASSELPKAQQAGLILKKLREEKGLSIHALSQITRIQKNYIEALEEGRLKDLPGLFFVSSFIRYIGKELDVSQETIKEICQLAAGVVTPAPLSEATEAPNTIPSKGKSSKSGALEPLFKKMLPNLKQKSQIFKIPPWFNCEKTLKLSRLLVILTVIFSGIYGIGKYTNLTKQPQEAIPEPVSKATPTPPPSAPPVEFDNPPPPPEESLGEVVENEPTEAPAPENAANIQEKNAKLGILVKETVDIRKSCDGLSSERISLNPGQYNYEFEQQCEVMIYDAGSVEVFLNDKPLGHLGQKKRVRRLAFVNERSDTKVQ